MGSLFKHTAVKSVNWSHQNALLHLTVVTHSLIPPPPSSHVLTKALHKWHTQLASQGRVSYVIATARDKWQNGTPNVLHPPKNSIRTARMAHSPV